MNRLSIPSKWICGYSSYLALKVHAEGATVGVENTGAAETVARGMEILDRKRNGLLQSQFWHVLHPAVVPSEEAKGIAVLEGD